MQPIECLIASNSHGAYCVPASSKHRPAARTILEGEIWEPKTLAFLTENCGIGDIIHAGTYFGDFLPALSRAVAPDAQIWAFEPSRENFECAKITLKLNDIRNVRLTHAALGDVRGTAPLCTGDRKGQAAGGASSIAAERLPGFSYEEAKVVTVDESIPPGRSISVLQLDVEHHEQQALAGALATIRRFRPVLVLETVPSDQRWFDANILALGYKEIGKLHRNRAFRAKAS